jgi:hypothetical protein
MPGFKLKIKKKKIGFFPPPKFPKFFGMKKHKLFMEKHTYNQIFRFFSPPLFLSFFQEEEEEGKKSIHQNKV